MDIADRAAALEEHARQIALTQALNQQSTQGKADCQDCGEPIPALRRQANPCAVRCIACQAEYEKSR